MRQLVFVLALAAAACQTPCPPVQPSAVAVRFVCEDTSMLAVTFGASSAHVEQQGYRALDLPQAAASSGFRYAANGAELRGQPGDARWIRPGAAETICRAAN